MNRLATVLIVTIGLGTGTGHAASSPPSMQDTTSVKAPYAIWREQRMARYEQFREKYLARYQAYRLGIISRWGKPELSDATHYVHYSDDLTKKVVIDYESNQIRVAVLEEPAKPVTLDIAEELVVLAQRSVQTALESDPVVALGQNSDSRSLLESALGAAGEPALADAVKLAATTRIDVTPLPLSLQAEASVRQQARRERQGSHPKSQANNDPDDSAIRAAFDQARANQQHVKHRIRTYVITLPEDTMLKRAKHYAAPIATAAESYNLDPALVYAITQIESAFNPLARSHIPAFGLMQIVPTSAGKDVNKLLYQKSKAPSAERLLDAEENLKFGTAYLHLLNSRYLRRISDPESRLYCMIAAYNTGAGNVASVFHPQGEKKIRAAAMAINALSPAEVYQRLIEKLPYQETRHYLKKVNIALEQYKKALKTPSPLNAI